MSSTMISNGVLLLYQQRRKSKIIKNKILQGAGITLSLWHQSIFDFFN